MSGFDHRRIRDEQDRSFTMALIDALRDLDPGDPAWPETLETLRWLEDYRSVGPLRGLVQDRQRPAAARAEAGKTLTSFDLATTSAQRAAWWRSGDEVIQTYSMRLMDRSDAEIVLPTATDPDHPLQWLAVATLEMGIRGGRIPGGQARRPG